MKTIERVRGSHGAAGVASQAAQCRPTMCVRLMRSRSSADFLPCGFTSASGRCLAAGPWALGNSAPRALAVNNGPRRPRAR
jgi:hypothetical protein